MKSCETLTLLIRRCGGCAPVAPVVGASSPSDEWSLPDSECDCPAAAAADALAACASPAALAALSCATLIFLAAGAAAALAWPATPLAPPPFACCACVCVCVRPLFASCHTRPACMSVGACTSLSLRLSVADRDSDRSRSAAAAGGDCSDGGDCCCCSRSMVGQFRSVSSVLVQRCDWQSRWCAAVAACAWVVVCGAAVWWREQTAAVGSNGKEQERRQKQKEAKRKAKSDFRPVRAPCKETRRRSLANNTNNKAIRHTGRG